MIIKGFVTARMVLHVMLSWSARLIIELVTSIAGDWALDCAQMVSNGYIPAVGAPSSSFNV